MAGKNIQIKQHNGTSWDNLYPKTKAGVVELTNGKTVESEITTLKNGKVEKESGKGLSTNDFTSTLKNKLDGLKDHSNEIKELKDSSYTKSEVDNKISTATTGIPVSPEEPDEGASLWFEEI